MIEQSAQGDDSLATLAPVEEAGQETSETQSGKKTKQRHRIFYAFVKGTNVYQSTHRVKLKEALKKDGLTLADVDIVYGAPKAVKSKTAFTF